MAFWGQNKAGQKCAARWAELAVLFCRYIAQKAIMRIQFLAYFWNPLIKWTWKILWMLERLFVVFCDHSKNIQWCIHFYHFFGLYKRKSLPGTKFFGSIQIDSSSKSSLPSWSVSRSWLKYLDISCWFWSSNMDKNSFSFTYPS